MCNIRKVSSCDGAVVHVVHVGGGEKLFATAYSLLPDLQES